MSRYRNVFHAHVSKVSYHMHANQSMCKNQMLSLYKIVIERRDRALRNVPKSCIFILDSLFTGFGERVMIDIVICDNNSVQARALSGMVQ